MKDIIKSIEDAQLKPEVDSFRVGAFRFFTSSREYYTIRGTRLCR